MNDHTPLTEQQLNEIEARANAATSGPWGAYTFGGDTLIEIAADLEDTGTGYRARRAICRLEDEPLDNDQTHREWTAEEDWAQVRADAEFIVHASTDVPALLAEVRRLRARVAQLERPAVEAKRNEIRQSYAELIAVAEETKDFEGAFDVQCRLREREEQWARIDAASSLRPAATPQAAEPVAATEAPAARHTCYNQTSVDVPASNCPHCRALPASLTATTPPTAYSDGKGRVFCLKCAPAIGADVALTANDVEAYELCPSCGRHVVDVACGEA